MISTSLFQMLFMKVQMLLASTYHWSFKMSKQIAPVTELIFGCQIFVKNFTYNFSLEKKMNLCLYMVLSILCINLCREKSIHVINHPQTD